MQTLNKGIFKKKIKGKVNKTLKKVHKKDTNFIWMKENSMCPNIYWHLLSLNLDSNGRPPGKTGKSKEHN